MLVHEAWFSQAKRQQASRKKQETSIHLTSEHFITHHMWSAFCSPLFHPVYTPTSLCSLLSNTRWGWCTCLPRRQDCVIFQWGVWGCCLGPIKATDQTNLDCRCLENASTCTPAFMLQVTHPYDRSINCFILPISVHFLSFLTLCLSLRRTTTMLYIQTAFKRLSHTQKHVLTCQFSKAYVSLIQLTVSRKHGCWVFSGHRAEEINMTGQVSPLRLIQRENHGFSRLYLQCPDSHK